MIDIADLLNRVNNQGVGLGSNLSQPRGIISALLPYLLVISGLILLFMLISGGFQIMTAVSDPDKASAGKQRITAAIAGFILLLASYWIAQLLQIIFGINILV